MDAFEPLINLLVLLGTLSIAAERLANLSKLAHPDLSRRRGSRFNLELRQVAHGSLKIKRRAYAQHQLPNPVQLADGTLIHKPARW